jgi:hypothetical protein
MSALPGDACDLATRHQRARLRGCASHTQARAVQLERRIIAPVALTTVVDQVNRGVALTTQRRDLDVPPGPART